MPENEIHLIFRELQEFIGRPNAFRSLLILLASMLVAYWFSHFVAKFIILIAKLVGNQSDAESNEIKKLRLRRIETHLSVAIAFTRAAIVGTVAFYVWQLISPAANLSTAAIGASAFFIVVAGATLGMILRDITAGSAMIIERWFDVGDYVRVEPFLDVNGVVERITLRSTKLRNLNGEVIWMHNQYMQTVKVTPGGLRTIAIDVFVNDLKAGEALIKKVVDTIPIGPLTVADPPKIIRKEQWGGGLWLLTIVGKTPPGREWLMEDYFVDSIKDLNKSMTDKPVMVRKPLVRYADPAAERSFRRAVRIKK